MCEKGHSSCSSHLLVAHHGSNTPMTASAVHQCWSGPGGGGVFSAANTPTPALQLYAAVAATSKYIHTHPEGGGRHQQLPCSAAQPPGLSPPLLSPTNTLPLRAAAAAFFCLLLSQPTLNRPTADPQPTHNRPVPAPACSGATSACCCWCWTAQPARHGSLPCAAAWPGGESRRPASQMNPGFIPWYTLGPYGCGQGGKCRHVC
jgi:hypothetical protein